MKTNYYLAIGIIVCAGVAAGCRQQSVKAAQPPTSVRVKAVEMSPVAGGGARYSATIKPETEVQLAFKVSGYIDRLLQVRGVDGQMRDVQEGDRVAKGTALARVRQSDYAVKVSQAESQASETRSALESSKAQFSEAQSSIASGKAQLAEAEASFEKARLDFERAKSLFASHSLTKTEYDATKAQFEMAEAKRDAARSQVGMLEARANAARSQIEATQAKVKGAQAMVAEASIPLQDTALRAPMNAVVLQKTVAVGALVSPGASGFVIADTSSVKVSFGVPDLALARLKSGSFLAVTVEAIPGREFRGQITRISPSADSKSRVFEVEVTIPNTDQLLKVGMIAALEAGEATLSSQNPIVPLSAIVRSKDQPDQYAVYVVEEKAGQAVAHLRNIRLGEAFGSAIAVVEGVAIGERVITMGAMLVKDGQPVQVIP